MKLESQFERLFRREEFVFRVFRESTNRKNLRYKVLRNATIDTLNRILKSTLTESFVRDSRIIMFVSTISDISHVIGNSRYSKFMTSHSSDDSTSKRADSAKQWTSGEFPIMVSTSGFGVGIDVKNVRLVVCFGKPFGFEAMVQQFGRGGRDGQPCDTYLLDRGFNDNPSSDELIKAYAHNQSKCRRLLITSYLDPLEIDCVGSDSLLCDVCDEEVDKNRTDLVVQLHDEIPEIPESQPITASGLTKEGEKFNNSEEIFRIKLLHAVETAKNSVLLG